MNFAKFLTQTSSENNNSCDYYTQLVQTKFNTGTSHPGNHCSSLSQVQQHASYDCVSDNFADFITKSPKLSICYCQYSICSPEFKRTPKISWRNNLPSQVEHLQYNNRLHMTVCFINFSRHSIIVDRARGTGLIILTQNNSQHCNTSYCWIYISQ